MKFPSIVKVSRHNRFKYEPRYYDPIKEEIDEKLRVARKEIKEGADMQYTSNISAAFQRRQRGTGQSSVLQLVIAVLLMATFIGWLFYGNDVFYGFLLLAPLYFYFRLKKRRPVK